MDKQILPSSWPQDQQRFVYFNSFLLSDIASAKFIWVLTPVEIGHQQVTIFDLCSRITLSYNRKFSKWKGHNVYLLKVAYLLKEFAQSLSGFNGHGIATSLTPLLGTVKADHAETGAFGLCEVQMRVNGRRYTKMVIGYFGFDLCTLFCGLE